jgi:hypothetical protein
VAVADGKNKFETCTTTCGEGAEGGRAGELTYPDGVAVDGSGDVFVTDGDNPRVDECVVSPHRVTRHKVHKPASVVEFYAGLPLRYLGCEMDAGRPQNPPVTGEVFRQDQSPTSSQVVTLVASGSVHICAEQGANKCGQGNFGLNTPTFAVGKKVTVWSLRCEVLSLGIRCTLTATGKGFLMRPTKTIRVG